MSEELKPCPFCGGKAEIVRVYAVNEVACRTKHCPLCWTGASMLVDEWNTRAQQGVTDKQAAIALRVWQAGNPDHGSINIMKDAIRAALHSDEDDKK